jgi:hypothetical protein
MTLASTILAAWLGSMFVYSATGKLADYRRSSRSILAYRILPEAVAVGAGLLLPWVELAAGVSLLSAPAWRSGSIVATSLGLVFLLASGSVLARKIDVSCGCAASSTDRVSLITCARACAIVAAGSVLLAGRASPLPPAALAVIAGLSVAPALVLVSRKAIAARRDRAARALPEQDVAHLLDVLASPLPDDPEVESIGGTLGLSIARGRSGPSVPWPDAGSTA